MELHSIESVKDTFLSSRICFNAFLSYLQRTDKTEMNKVCDLNKQNYCFSFLLNYAVMECRWMPDILLSILNDHGVN